VVDRVFGKATVGGKAVSAMALLGLSVVEAGGVHALAASLALAATGMDFHADALADLKFVDVGSQRCDRAHILMTWREILVEWQATQDAGRRSRMDDLKISGADRDRIDSDQNFGACGYGRRLVTQEKLVGPAENPGLHLLGYGQFT
jgi:hypothetical protein